MPKVSVVVPNYNHAQFLRQRLDSILAQTFQDFELILLDDCSTDESRSILEEYARDPRVRLEFNETNSGSTFKQWNKGVRMARGKYVWIAESDDYAEPQLLGRLVPLLDEGSGIALAYCRSRLLRQGDKLDGFGDYYLVELDAGQWVSDFIMSGDSMCRKYFYRKNAVPNASSVVFRRDIYQRVGGADESLTLCGDWKLWAAMALTGGVAYLAEPLNYWRYHDSSVWGRAESARVAAEFLEVSRWVLDRVGCAGEEREELCETTMGMWLRPLLRFRTPLAMKWRLVRGAWALDPHAVRRAFRPALTMVRLKLGRQWREFREMSPLRRNATHADE